jgi:hypothetical protein
VTATADLEVAGEACPPGIRRRRSQTVSIPASCPSLSCGGIGDAASQSRPQPLQRTFFEPPRSSLGNRREAPLWGDAFALLPDGAVLSVRCRRCPTDGTARLTPPRRHRHRPPKPPPMRPSGAQNVWRPERPASVLSAGGPPCTGKRSPIRESSACPLPATGRALVPRKIPPTSPRRLRPCDSLVSDRTMPPSVPARRCTALYVAEFLGSVSRSGRSPMRGTSVKVTAKTAASPFLFGVVWHGPRWGRPEHRLAGKALQGLDGAVRFRRGHGPRRGDVPDTGQNQDSEPLGAG